MRRHCRRAHVPKTFPSRLPAPLPEHRPSASPIRAPSGGFALHMPMHTPPPYASGPAPPSRPPALSSHAHVSPPRLFLAAPRPPLVAPRAACHARAASVPSPAQKPPPEGLHEHCPSEPRVARLERAALPGAASLSSLPPPSSTGRALVLHQGNQGNHGCNQGCNQGPITAR